MTFAVCIPIPALPDPQRLVLPGGVVIEHINLLSMVQPALAPYMPLVDIVEAVTAVVKAIEELPKVLLRIIGPPPKAPQPEAIREILPVKQIEKIARLLPHVAVPVMIGGVLDAILRALRDARAELGHLHTQKEQVLGVIDRGKALQDPQLVAVGECMQLNVHREAMNVGKQLASLGHLFGLVNALMGLVNGPKLPDLNNLVGQDLDGICAPLDALIGALGSARKVLP